MKSVEDLTVEELRGVVTVLCEHLASEDCNGGDLVEAMSQAMANVGVDLAPEETGATEGDGPALEPSFPSRVLLREGRGPGGA